MSHHSNQRPLGSPPSSSVSEKVAISAPLVPHEPQIHCRKAHPKNPSNAFRFEYLGEGAANVVFRVRPFLDQDGSFEQEAFIFENQNGIGLTHQELDRKVLRMSKGKPKTLRYKEIMAGFQDDILPLFRMSTPRSESNDNGEKATPRESLNLNITTSFEEFVMQHRGVSICPEALRVLISKLHQHCPHNRHITPHHLDEEGILLPDMSSEPRQSFFTVEVKPKWLLQSPNAPRDAYLCRTCARHESRKGKKESKGPSICPLALAVGNAPAIEEWLRVTLEEASAKKQLESTVIDKLVDRALVYLTKGPGHALLQHLRYLQAQTDKHGVLGAQLNKDDTEDPSNDNSAYGLRLAMTLRDCSLFLRIPYAESLPLEAKLGDLDFKSSDKMDDWYEKEEALVNGGWYINVGDGIPGGPSGCWVASGWTMHAPRYF